MSKVLKTKRYFGKKSNVETNLYFEEYLNIVAQSKTVIVYISFILKLNCADPNKILADGYVPAGLVSKTKACRVNGLTADVSFSIIDLLLSSLAGF